MKKIALIIITCFLICCNGQYKPLNDSFVFTSDSEFSYTCQSYYLIQIEILSKNTNGVIKLYRQNSLPDINWTEYKEIIIDPNTPEINKTIEAYTTKNKIVYIPCEGNSDNEYVKINILRTELMYSNNMRELTRNQIRYDRDVNFGLKHFYGDNGYGYKRGDEIIIPSKYPYVEKFGPKGLARVRLNPKGSGYPASEVNQHIYKDNEGLDGFIDTLGNVIIPLEYGVIGELGYSDVAEFTKGLNKTVGGETIRTEKYGLINDKGEVVLEPIYDLILPYYRYNSNMLGKAPVIFMARNYNYAKDSSILGVKEQMLIDKKGNILSPNGKYDILIPYEKELSSYFTSDNPYDYEIFYVERDGKAGVLNRQLELVVPLEHVVSDRKTSQEDLLLLYAKRFK